MQKKPLLKFAFFVFCKQKYIFIQVLTIFSIKKKKNIIYEASFDSKKVFQFSQLNYKLRIQINT